MQHPKEDDVYVIRIATHLSVSSSDEDLSSAGSLRRKELSMRGSVTVVAILLGLSIVGCGDSNPLPSAPSTLQLVSVGAIGYGSAGQLQLFATAHFSDGGHDVTALATWSNSDPTVANLSTA